MRMQLSENAKEKIITAMKWQTVVTTTLFTTNQGLLVFSFWMQRLQALKDGASVISGLFGIMTWLQTATYVSAFGIASCDHLFDLETETLSKSKAQKALAFLLTALRWILSINKAFTFSGLGMLACQTVAEERGWHFFESPGLEYSYGVIGIICNFTFFLGILQNMKEVLKQDLNLWTAYYKNKEALPESWNTKKEIMKIAFALFLTGIAITGILNFSVPAKLAAQRWGYEAIDSFTSPLSVTQMGMITFTALYPQVRMAPKLKTPQPELRLLEQEEDQRAPAEAEGAAHVPYKVIAFLIISAFIASTSNIFVMQKYLKDNNTPPTSAKGMIFLAGSCLTYALPTIFGMLFWTKKYYAQPPTQRSCCRREP